MFNKIWKKHKGTTMILIKKMKQCMKNYGKI